MYQLIANSTVIKRLADNASIPNDPANTDYQAYLKWVDEGNTPQAADPIPEPTPQPQPTLAELQAQLQSIALQITQISNNKV